MPTYEGPWLTATNIRTIMSDSALVRIKLEAPVQWEFRTGDREFPEGMNMEFQELDGHVSSTVTSQKGYYYAETQLWKVTGKVVLEGIDNGERLTTEELWWDPAKKEVFTDEFVTIRQGDEVLTGTELRAKQDFSEYTLNNIIAEYTVESEAPQPE